MTSERILWLFFWFGGMATAALYPGADQNGWLWAVLSLIFLVGGLIMYKRGK